MARYITVGTDENPRYMVEAVGDDSPLRSADVTHIAGLQAVGSAVVDVCSTIVDELAQAAKLAGPSEVELELGVSLAADGGIPVFAKLSTEGTFKVTLRWNATAMDRLSGRAEPG